MIFLRLILGAILFVCTVWLSLLWGGPTLIRYFVEVYYGDTIKLGPVIVSPKMEIEISRIEINRQEDNRITNFLNARSVKINFFPNANSSLVRVRSGPIEIESFFSAESVSIFISPVSFFSNVGSNLKVNGQGVLVKEGVSIEQLEMSAYHDPTNSHLKDIVFMGSTVSFDNDLGLDLEKFNGVGDFLDLKKPLSLQTNTFEIVPGPLIVGKNNLKFEEPSLRILNTYGDFSLVFASKSAFESNNQELVKVNELLAKFNYDLHQNKTTNLNQIKIKNLLSSAFKFQSHNVHADIKIDDSFYEFDINGLINDWEFSRKNFLVGSLSDVQLAASFKGNYTSLDSYFWSDFSSYLGAKEPVNIKGRLGVKLPKSNNALECYDLNCLIKYLDLSFEVTVSDDSIFGRIKCETVTCSKSSDLISLSTTNTAGFIDGLASTKIISPIALSMFYTLIISGEQVANGHHIRF